jgi:DNA repair ATPase RecN
MKDLALVSELRLERAPGHAVLTGATGAGTSMLPPTPTRARAR